MIDDETANRITYAFGHMVASYKPEDPHSADSADLAQDVLEELGVSEVTIATLWVVADHVAGNYQYTGEAKEIVDRIENGEL